ncbi:unnamed protein product [Protopolystoma xenopodis]|uniref:Uncharacterized protein n=1 Tax=Protopolystoma xenopodis TaxID=117903 RepID=A0A448X6D1_9PLAT|nr:unnamed protein product [Protopolystoma xenopodis]
MVMLYHFVNDGNGCEVVWRNNVRSGRPSTMTVLGSSPVGASSRGRLSEKTTRGQQGAILVGQMDILLAGRLCRWMMEKHAQIEATASSQHCRISAVHHLTGLTGRPAGNRRSHATELAIANIALSIPAYSGRLRVGQRYERLVGSVLGPSCLPGQGAEALGPRRLDLLFTTAPRVLTARRTCLCPHVELCRDSTTTESTFAHFRQTLWVVWAERVSRAKPIRREPCRTGLRLLFT